jgi:uncharacterized protein YfaT (DUF1175 family)
MRGYAALEAIKQHFGKSAVRSNGYSKRDKTPLVFIGEPAYRVLASYLSNLQKQ